MAGMASPALKLPVVCVKFSKLVMGAGFGSFQVNSDIPMFDRRDHPFAPTCLWQSAGRSGSQGCRRDGGGTGGAGAQRR